MLGLEGSGQILSQLEREVVCMLPNMEIVFEAIVIL
jgi:hypothetical protein